MTVEALDQLLTEIRREYRRVLIAIEGVYSMDGDYPGPAAICRGQAASQGAADDRRSTLHGDDGTARTGDRRAL